jgi:serine/threonine protein kinase
LSGAFAFCPNIRISDLHTNAIRKLNKKNNVRIRCFTLLHFGRDSSVWHLKSSHSNKLTNKKPANLPSELSGSLLQKLFGIETDNIRDTITEMLEKEPKNRMTSSDVVNRLTQINQIVRIRCFTLLLTLATTIELSFLFY